MLFFKEHKDYFLVDIVQQRKLLILSLSLIIILGITISVTAFYFDFQYFETDKTVYEIGETINMVSSLIADFSNDGYCFVSFAIVTDQGPAFADEYYIPPSPNARLINSNYTIHPNHTSPGEDGITAYALFNVEIYDTVTQGASENVEITITRGRLTVYPTTSLIIQSDTNTTITLHVGSIHENTIVYPNEEIGVLIRNPSSEIIYNDNSTTALDGSININWNQSMGQPGIYDLTITGFGNEDFLEFTKEFQVSVVPKSSNLTVVSAPDFVPCQSPDGSYFDYANIIIRHEAADYTRINDSTIFWNSSFGNGYLILIDEGEYSVSIPCLIPSGLYTINITAINPSYQNTSLSILVNVVKNPLIFTTIQNQQSVVHGENLTIEFLIEEGISWNQKILLDISDQLSEISSQIDIYPNTTTLLIINAWHNLTLGPHNLSITVMSDYYAFSVTPELEIIIIGELSFNVSIESAYYGENMQLQLSIFDYNSDIIEMANLTVYYDTEINPFFTQQINSTQIIFVPLPLRISHGYHEFRFEIIAPYYMNEITAKNITILMRTNITIIIETILYSSISSIENNSRYVISLNQATLLVLSYDRHQLCLMKSPQSYLVPHVIPLLIIVPNSAQE